jgi:predicted thioesterase
LGANVTCLARLISTEGLTATFHVEARDEHEVIARGIHKRGIIRVESFAKRVARKTRTNA